MYNLEKHVGDKMHNKCQVFCLKKENLSDLSKVS